MPTALPEAAPPPEPREGANLPPAYEAQAVLDLVSRVRYGLWMYVLIWPVLMLADGYAARHHGFVWGNGLALLATAIIRWHVHAGIPRMLKNDLTRTRVLYRALSIAQHLYWGLLCALIVTDPDAPTLKWLMLICTVGITAGGTVIVAIDRLLPALYAPCTLGPTALAVLPAGGSTNMAIVGLTVLLAAYSRVLYRLVGQDYWERQRTHFLLELRAAELEAISRTDALTRVANRMKFEERLTQTWRDACRRQEPLALAMVDLDHFKRINDRHGHPFGDRCLQAAASALSQAMLRPYDLVARYGGEEFVILMPNTDLAGAHEVAQRALAAVCAIEVMDKALPVPLSCSIGVAMVYPGPRHRSEQLVAAADWALYEAKQAGRCRVVCDDQPPLPLSHVTLASA